MVRPSFVAVLAFGAVISSRARTVPPAPTPRGPDRSSIVLLGTGTPAPDPDAFGPATAITVGDRLFLIDAGDGITRRMRAAGLPLNGITALFVTHLHSDHTLGYPDLILTTWLMRRMKPFDVYGPPGVQRMTDDILAAWAEDIEVRVKGLEREAPAYGVAVHEIEPGVAYDRAGVKVTAIAVSHGSWRHAYGYRFDLPDRVVVLAGDTRPTETLVAAARGCDVLIHEVYPSGRVAPEDRPGGELWPEYLKAFHTSDVELGALAARIQPRLLVLDHIVRMGGTDQEIIEGIRKGGFAGRVVVGKDLERY
jgi:ribonuclease BN (tRNA processing enzyme)